MYLYHCIPYLAEQRGIALWSRCGRASLWSGKVDARRRSDDDDDDETTCFLKTSVKLTPFYIPRSPESRIPLDPGSRRLIPRDPSPFSLGVHRSVAPFVPSSLPSQRGISRNLPVGAFCKRVDGGPCTVRTCAYRRLTTDRPRDRLAAAARASLRHTDRPARSKPFHRTPNYVRRAVGSTSRRRRGDDASTNVDCRQVL